jgi:hypothetical protein
MMMIGALSGLYYSIFLNDKDYIFPIIGITLLTIAGVIDAHRATTLIDEKEVFYDSFLQKKRLLIGNIDSFEVNEYGIKLHAKEGKPKSVTVSNYLKHYDQAYYWAKENFPRRDKDIYEEEFIDALTDQTYGHNTKERFTQIEKAEKQVKWLNILMWSIPLAHLIFKQIHFITLPSLLIFPLVVTGFVIYYKGAIKLYDTKRHDSHFYPNLLTALAISCVTTALFAIFKYDIYYWNNNWINFLILSIILSAAIYFYAPKALETKLSSKIGTLLFLLLFYFFYSLGLVVGINCSYDTSQPKMYEAVVGQKSISKGKTHSHNFKLQEWGPKNKTTTLENLKAAYYDSVSEGDTILVKYRDGLLNIPWYETE